MRREDDCRSLKEFSDTVHQGVQIEVASLQKIPILFPISTRKKDLQGLQAKVCYNRSRRRIAPSAWLYAGGLKARERRESA